MVRRIVVDDCQGIEEGVAPLPLLFMPRLQATSRPTSVVVTVFFLVLIALWFSAKPVQAGPHHRYKQGQTKHDPFLWVAYVSANANIYAKGSRYAYPAPSGEEDSELLPETLSSVRGLMPGAECTGNSKDYKSAANSNGTWWFSQVIGDDPASRAGSVGSHWGDMQYTDPTGHVAFAGAAFDVVLSSVSTFQKYPPAIDGTENAAVSNAFYSYVQGMRDAGIVCWHRWAADPLQPSGATNENEIHCIETACYGYTAITPTPGGGTTFTTYPTLMKSFLRGQVDQYINDGGTGSSHYSRDYIITNTQKMQAANRMNNADQGHTYSRIKTNHPDISYSLLAPS